eukprot:GHUV01055710.1.p1 GENE.GHUV01055710.1~~GHUV01055710.1.p1  ORF type:complete len:320 (+),score=108.01 GHUV01055710.1:265-1224(+)
MVRNMFGQGPGANLGMHFPPKCVSTPEIQQLGLSWIGCNPLIGARSIDQMWAWGHTGDHNKSTTRAWGQTSNKPCTAVIGRPSAAAVASASVNLCMQTILPQQELLKEPDHYQAMLKYIPDEAIVQQLSAKWAAGGQGILPGGSSRRSSAASACNTSLSLCRWNELEKTVNDKALRLQFDNQREKFRKCLSDNIFAYSYPRLDVEVTEKMNHLLKAPFCVHPKTGKVCVPIDPAAAWEFDPDEVPTVQQLVQEMNEQQQQSGAQQQQVDGWKGTSLEPYIDAFTIGFLAPLTSSNKAALNVKAKQAAAEQRGHRVDVSW